MLLAHVSDIHIGQDFRGDGGARALARTRKVIDYLNAVPGDLDGVLVTGDLADHGTPAEYEIVRELLGTLRVPVLICPGNHDERRGEASMCDRDPCQQGRGDGGGDPRHDLTADAGGSQCQRLLSTPPEHERVAALEAHDTPPAAGFANHQSVDRVLADGRTSCTLTDEESARRGGIIERVGRNERVVEHQIRRSQPAHGSERQELRISGPGADKRYEPTHVVASRT